MLMPNRLLSLAILPIITLFVGWQLGAISQTGQINDLKHRLDGLSGLTASGAVAGDPEKEVDLSLMWNVWRLLQTKYIEPGDLEARKMSLGAVAGMVSAVGDPYTVFMTPKENTDFRQGLSGHLQGIGAQLSQSGTFVVVVSPIKGSPAAKAGLQPDDVILQIDGKDITGQSLEEVVSQIRGPKGSTVKLGIGREGEDDLLNIAIVRDDITVPSTEYEVKSGTGGDIGYLAINQFGDETIGEVRQILSGVDAKKLKGFIIDLRYNGGGYLDGAVELVSLFQKQGKVVDVAGRGDEPQRHYVNGKPILADIPLVVIVNEGSASASEITAGALQDNKRATIVGVKSFGKGTVQEVIDLAGGTSLRVTIAHWLTPNGRNLSKEGVIPDVIIERTREQMIAGQDPQLEKAMEVLLK